MARKSRRGGSNPLAGLFDPTDIYNFSTKLPVLAPDVESKPQPAPVKGWDAISPLSGMEPDYAVVLDNAVPRPGYVEIRGGCIPWVQGLGDAVKTLFVYRPADNIEELMAAAGGMIFAASTYAAPTLMASGYANDRWQYINFTPTGASTRLIAVNGNDDAQIYDGSTWADASITGVSTSLLINVNVHKQRIWFIEKDSTRAWYLATQAIAGAATAFDFGTLMTKGGQLVAMGTWTVDGGNGPDDYAVFVTSKGQAIVYKGTDPGNANAWFLVGTFNLPPPIGHRCFKSYGSDLLYISLEGLLPISKALPFDPSGVRSVALTNRIQNAMLNAAQNGRNLFGWQIELFPLQGLLLMNVPITEGVEQVQYVMNTLTGAWCRFTNWNLNCFEIFNESLFFGGNSGSVFLAYVGQNDVISPIAMDVKTAFNYYGDPGRQKNISMVRPFLRIGGAVVPTFGLDVDFGEDDFAAAVSSYQLFGALWDEALWDVAEWSSGSLSQPTNDWQAIGGIGTAIALRMKANIVSDTVFDAASAFDVGLFDTAVFDGAGVANSSGDNLPIVQLNSFQVTLEHGAPVG